MSIHKMISYMFTCNTRFQVRINKVMHVNIVKLLIDVNYWYCILLVTGMQQFFWHVNIVITYVCCMFSDLFYNV